MATFNLRREKQIENIFVNPSVTVFASAARAANANSDDQTNYISKGVRLYLDITARVGTNPTANFKVQVKSSLTGNYHDLAGASFAQKIAVGTDELIIYPGIGETANRAVSDVLSREWRIVFTVGGTATPTFTFSINAEYL